MAQTGICYPTQTKSSYYMTQPSNSNDGEVPLCYEFLSEVTEDKRVAHGLEFDIYHPHHSLVNLLKQILKMEEEKKTMMEKEGRLEASLSNKIGFEISGIEPVPEDDRTQKHIWENMTMWMSANVVLSTFSTGSLGVILFNLGFWQGFAVILAFNLIGSVPVAFFTTLGPLTGMRQMVITRYSFGWYGTWLMSLLNILACLGWSGVNSIVGGQVLNSLSNGALPVWAGILIISVITTIVSVIGYKVVHHYERVAFIPMLIIFFIVLGYSAPHWDTTPSKLTGAPLAASVLSFGGTIYGFAAGWTSYAADYNVHMPANTSKISIFLWTFFGLWFPLSFVEVLGFGAATSLAKNTDYAAAYASGSIGGLVGSILSPLGGFGKFLMVLLALSVVANNIPNDYSLGLSAQVFGGIFMKIRRYWWSLIGAVIYIIVAVVGQSNFVSTLESFLLVIGYWLASYSVVVFMEHVFRKAEYDVSAWDKKDELPVGWAGTLSLFIGFAGAILGMDQYYFAGPLAIAISPPFGGDIGFILAAGFTAISFGILRIFEKKIHGR
ncbi:hypothetical protein HK096_007103 [Nowakowskiella sp. JEL0078]|nr:hypothetical protein HK096_007103 [Nowakowskiella sp. JEL0078]